MMNAYSELEELAGIKPKQPVFQDIPTSVRIKVSRDSEFSLLKKQFDRDNTQKTQAKCLTKPPNKVLQTINQLFKNLSNRLPNPPTPHQIASLTAPLHAMSMSLPTSGALSW
jgi:hypothetical protein